MALRGGGGGRRRRSSAAATIEIRQTPRKWSVQPKIENASVPAVIWARLSFFPEPHLQSKWFFLIYSLLNISIYSDQPGYCRFNAVSVFICAPPCPSLPVVHVRSPGVISPLKKIKTLFRIIFSPVGITTLTHSSLFWAFIPPAVPVLLFCGKLWKEEMKRALWNVNKAQCKESMETAAGQEHRKWHSHAVPFVCFTKNIYEIEGCKYSVWPVEGEIISFI